MPRSDCRYRRCACTRQKGTEDQAVMVVLPRDRMPSTHTADVIAAWAAGEASEAERVLYVAVTRSEQSCALALPDLLGDRVVSLLEQGDVPFRVETI